MPQETVVLDALATVALSRLPSGPVSRPPLRAWLPLMNCSMSCMRRPEPLADATTHHSAPDGNLELDAFFNRPPSVRQAGRQVGARSSRSRARAGRDGATGEGESDAFVSTN
jgi:hypothetical protein